MLMRSHIPSPPLSNFVEMFWFYDGYVQPHAKERLLPTGTIELVVNLNEDETRMYDRNDLDKLESYRGSVVCGPHSEFFVIDTAEQASVIGVHFKPGGARPFFKLPADELHNQTVSLEDVWGREADRLRDRLLEARAVETRFAILEQALLARAYRPLLRHPAVAFALGQFNGESHKVSEVTDQIGLSSRRFIQVFSEDVGLTPKLYCRIRRFQQVLSRIQSSRQVEWADVALACGYFDQAHFIRDFRAFSGLNPSRYLTVRGEHLNHVPILD